jgi:putative DNA primase/helicase
LLADLGLFDTLLAELPGILTWAVAGCLAWQRDGRVRLPRIVRVATAEYKAEQDLLGPFLADCCILSTAEWVAFDELYVTYEGFAKRANERPLTKTKLGRELTERGFKEKREKGQRGRLGVRLRLDSDPRPPDEDVATDQEYRDNDEEPPW